MSEQSILDHPAIAERYFFPRRVTFADPFHVTAADGSQLACARVVVDPRAPTVVYFHGNGEVVADMLPDFPAWISTAGANVVLAEYRGYGMSTGTPALVGMLDDVGKILDAIDVPDDRLVLFGRSVGSIYALEAARRRPHAAALVIESGIFDVAERVRLRVSAVDLGVTEHAFAAELARCFDHAGVLSRFTGRTLVLHTRHDALVGVAHAERLHAAAHEPKMLQVFEQGGHNDIFWRNHAAYVAAVEGLLRAVA